jgi:hypothetical protein
MNTSVKRALRFFPALGASLAFIFSPTLALAQQSASMPPYAVGKDDVIRGTIANFNGATTIYVRDVRGYIDNVTLHKGTIINPTGIRLQAGYPVTISGHADGTTFVADQIDTPFRRVYAYGPAYVYPALGFGWSSGWGWGWRGWR